MISSPAPAVPTRPAWNELTPAQREALAPLAGMWPTLERDRKEKWLELARRYPNLSPDGKKRVQERMVEYAKLTPEQRRTARENFRRAYELPAEERQEKLQKFQELPADGQGSEGAVSEIDKMLKEYYEVRGWNNGVVPESKLVELGIDLVAQTK